MPYRCFNDATGYCSGEPEPDVKSSNTGFGGTLMGGHCRLDPNTCPKYQTFLESVRSQIDRTKSRVSDWSKFDLVNKTLATLTKLGK